MLSTVAVPLEAGVRKRVRMMGAAEPPKTTEKWVEVAKYMFWLGAQTKCISAPHVFSMGISIFYRIASRLDAVSLVGALIGSLSLAVDVCGDCEAEYARSALAWSHFFAEQVGQVRSFAEINESCHALLRVKFAIASSLGWNILAPTVASVVSESLVEIKKNGEKICLQCQCMSENSSSFIQHYEVLMHICSLVLVPLNVSVDAIAALVLLVAHQTFGSNSLVATPNRLLVHRIKRQLINATLKERHKCLEDCLKISEIHWDTAVLLVNSKKIQTSLIQLGESVKLSRNKTSVLETIEEAFEVFRESQSSDSINSTTV